MKVCRRCGKEKEEESFVGERGKETKTCAVCREYARGYMEERPDKALAYLKKHRERYKKNIEKERERQRKKYRRDIKKVQAAHKKWREENKEKIKEGNKRYNEADAKYDVFAHQLSENENPQLGDDGVLLVDCHFCRKQFTPTNKNARMRAGALKGCEGKRYLYCSEACKNNCPDFWQGKNIPLPEIGRSERWITRVKKRDNYTCQHCGSTTHIHAHHIVPVAVDPSLASKLSNGICLCEECHIKEHRKTGMTLQEIKKISHKRRKEESTKKQAKEGSKK